MNSIRSGLVIAAALAISPCLSSTLLPNSDPLAAIDMNRDAIIADIVKGFSTQSPDDAAKLKARLQKLRADKLLAASLASTPQSLEAIVSEGESSTLPSYNRTNAKSLGDSNKDLVYTPLTPCRLIDTRGFGAPIQGGPFAPNERRAYVPNGLCGIPTSGVSTLLISFTTQNLTSASGGYISILAPGAPVNTTVDIFNINSSWSASITAVPTGPAGQFDVFVNTANAHFVADVVGYFAPFQGNIALAQSSATAGNILKGANRFIHNFGTGNTFIGESAGNFTMTGFGNTASGNLALTANTIGNNNTASGANALQNNTTGGGNTAIGTAALQANTTGASNTASGNLALTANTIGNNNTASGASALQSNTTGTGNTVIGANALAGNTSGSNNTASGFNALAANTIGFENAAVGTFSLASNKSGAGNTAVGHWALLSNAGSYNNTAVGAQALLNSTGAGNIALGAFAGYNLTTGDSNIAIGHQGNAAEANTIRIGTVGTHASTFIAGISGATSSGGITVFVNGSGQLGTATSSRRFKHDIADMDSASNALMKLRPVTFRYKPEVDDGSRLLQYGLIAEEVESVYPGLVADGADGKAQTVRYQFLTPMLLNEYQKQHRRIEAQEQDAIRYKARLAEIEQDRKAQLARIAALEEQVAEVAALRRQMAHLTRLLDQRGIATLSAGLELK
jgi:polyhydroxyalkanoate synthesis regulator phasin